MTSRAERVAALEWSQTESQIRTHRAMKSNVVIVGRPQDYTDEELALLHAFSEERKAEYLARWTTFEGCNAIVIEKESIDMATLPGDRNAPDYSAGWCWKRRRMSWRHGGDSSATLVEALSVFRRDRWERVGLWAAHESGAIGRIESEVPYLEGGDRVTHVLRTPDRVARQVHWLGLAIVAESLEELVSLMDAARAERTRLNEIHAATGRSYGRRWARQEAYFLEPLGDLAEPVRVLASGHPLPLAPGSDELAKDLQVRGLMRTIERTGQAVYEATEAALYLHDKGAFVSSATALTLAEPA